MIGNRVVEEMVDLRSGHVDDICAIGGALYYRFVIRQRGEVVWSTFGMFGLGPAVLRKAEGYVPHRVVAAVTVGGFPFFDSLALYEVRWTLPSKGVDCPPANTMQTYLPHGIPITDCPSTSAQFLIRSHSSWVNGI